MIPCIVITRDRVSYTRQCIESLKRFNLEIHIVDHGSTYGPMVDYLRDIDGTFCPYIPVHYAGSHAPRDLWTWPALREIVGDSPYLVTDCDIILDPECPDDWLGELFDHLDFSGFSKVGLGIRVNDLPNTRLGIAAQTWEASFWMSPYGARAYRAPVDTTLALYPPLSHKPEFSIAPAVRLAAPYLIKHLPWYGDLDPEEAIYYKAHCLPGASHWVNGGWVLAP